MCEGDDYWTDPYKLKKQFDVLETNPDCYICLHKVEVINENGTSANRSLPTCDIPTCKMTSDQFYNDFKETELFQTSSFFILGEKYANYINDPPSFRKAAPVGDVPLLLYFSYIGNVYYINTVMSNYRSFSIGSWTSRIHDSSNVKESWKKRSNHITSMRNMLEEFFVFSGGKYKKDLSFMNDQFDKMEATLKDDIFWYCIENKEYKQLFKRLSIKELEKRGLSKKAILKINLQRIFPKMS